MNAATALEHDFTIVTRNVKDSAGLGVALLNPWDAVWFVTGRRRSYSALRSHKPLTEIAEPRKQGSAPASVRTLWRL